MKKLKIMKNLYLKIINQDEINNDNEVIEKKKMKLKIKK